MSNEQRKREEGRYGGKKYNFFRKDLTFYGKFGIFLNMKLFLVKNRIPHNLAAGADLAINGLLSLPPQL